MIPGVVAAIKKPGGGDKEGAFFSTQKKGEVAELKADLNSTDKFKLIPAVKKVIAAMTVGKDVSSLWADVTRSMQTDNLELKKLIYLYVINYARSQPDQAVLIVNTFVRDATCSSPLIRALAIRTMGCIRVDKITEQMVDPLARALRDPDPYVKKTAAVCVSKLYDLNPTLAQEGGFLESLRNLISDNNHMVVANAVAALAEISENSGKDMMRIDSSMLSKLLAALNECTEWGQVFILDCLSKYEAGAKEAEDIIERVSPRLKHSNSAVLLSAVKVIMRQLKKISNTGLEKRVLQEKLPPPLITLLSDTKPEIQYVALRNINLIVQKDPSILQNGVKHFFCKYNDPIYVKLEKLEIMIQLANDKNVDKVLMEFKEYATEVDVEFVRKAVTAIGRCAIKLDLAADKCIKVLVELIQSKVNYVVQEAVIVIRDIFRKYPAKYLTIIATLCENLESLDEPDAKAAMIWIVGEYANHIENSPFLLEQFMDSFEDEPAEVQLQLLTAVVKMFLKRPDDGKDMVTKVLNLATEKSENPDLRDRGFVYWRLLSSNPETAQAVVLAKKPVISDDMFQLDPAVLDLLLKNLNTLASIYHKPPEHFLAGGQASIVLKPTTAPQKKTKRVVESESSSSDSDEGGGKEEEGRAEGPKGNASGSDTGSPDDSDEEGKAARKKAAASASPDHRADQKEGPSSDDEDDQPKRGGGGGGGGGHATSAPAATLDLLGLDLMSLGVGGPAPAPSGGSQHEKPVVLNARQGKGLQIRCQFARRQNAAGLELVFENQTSFPLTNFAIRFNVNVPGLQATRLDMGQLSPGESKEAFMPFSLVEPALEAKPVGALQVAVKVDPLGVLFFNTPLAVKMVFQEDGLLDKAAFLSLWPSIEEEEEKEVANPAYSTTDAVKARLTSNNVFFIAVRSVPERGEVMYFSLLLRGVVCLVEVTLKTGAPGCVVCVKSKQKLAGSISLTLIRDLLQTR